MQKKSSIGHRSLLLFSMKLKKIYIMKNGRTSPIKWQDLQPVFEKAANNKLNSSKALKNKYDGMRKEYGLWKSLKFGETGLGWDEIASGIDCVAPSMDPNNNVPHLIIDDEDPGVGGHVPKGEAETSDNPLFSSQYLQQCTPLENRENGDDAYFSNLMGFTTDVFSPNIVGDLILRRVPKKMKCNKRESSGVKMFKNFMVEQNSNQKHTIEILEMDASPIN
ncbi:hypothetical protein LXL04_019097 [Taraxacum kok-saghyz]